MRKRKLRKWALYLLRAIVFLVSGFGLSFVIIGGLFDIAIMMFWGFVAFALVFVLEPWL